MTASPDDVTAITAALWERFRPLVAERVQQLRAWAAAEASVSRSEANRAAHNLAGSLGSYGRAEGSVIARRADVLLASGASDDEVRGELGQLIPELERVVRQ